jgi:HEAT repeat protein
VGNNHIFLLPFIALAQGLLAPGINDGAGQLMLTLAPERSRTAYVAWYSTIVGLLTAAGAPTGGVLDDALGGFSRQFGPVTVRSFQVVVLACFVLCLASFFVLSRIREGREKPMAWVLARLVTPSVFRTFMNISVIGRPQSSDRVARALRTTEAGSGAIAVKDIIGRLEDPDAEVREEAAKALGRIGSADAVEALMRHLGDSCSTIRPQAARALGRIGDRRAIPGLIAGLGDRSEEVQEACCMALGRIGAPEALDRLVGLLTEERSDRVAAAAGEAMSRLGALEAALDLLPRMHATASRSMLRQFSIALGNLLGRPGGFYAWLTAEPSSRSLALGRMLADAWRVVDAIAPDAGTGFESSTTLQSTRSRMAALGRAVERHDIPEALGLLYDVLLGLCRHLSGHDIPEDEALGFAFMRSARLGLALWFASEVRTRMAAITSAELAEIDLALGLYAFASYEEPAEED